MLYKLTLWHESINYLTFVSNIFITKHFNYEEKIITIYNVNNRGEINPIVKRYGTNLPASTSYDMLKSHAADLKELGIRYVRLSAGWGQEGQGLYNNKQVSVNGDFIEYYCQIYSPRETG